MAIKFLSGVNIDSNTLFVDDVNNRVGIGTASPTSQLHVQSSAPELLLYNTTTAGGTLNFVDQAWQSQIVGIQGNLLLKTGGTTERVRITNDGNVGIGTTAPTETLDLRGVLRVSRSGVNDSGIIAFGNYANGAGYYDNGIFRSSLNAITTSGNVLHMGSYEALAFTASANPLGSQTIRMYISGTSGNVGIGTTSPSQKLEVAGALVVGMTVPAPFWNAQFKDFSDGSGIYISSVNGGGGKYIAGNAYYYNSTLWRSDKTVASAINLDNGTVIFYTNSGLTPNVDYSPTERMRISSSGNISIGNTNNTFLLDVGASNLYPFRALSSSGAGFQVNGSYIYADAYNHVFRSLSGTTTYATIDNNGNVGIGTTAPSEKLEVVGIISSARTTYGNPSDAGGFRIKVQDYGGIHNDAGIGIESNLGLMWFNNVAGGGFYWNDGTGGERMRLTSDGNLGLGLTAPTSKLHIFGGGDQSITIQSSTTASSTSSFVKYIRATTGSARTWWTGVGIQGGTDNSFSFYDETAGSERMRITSAGYVGIGIQNPSYLLDVNGSINARSNSQVSGNAQVFTIDGTNHAYYAWNVAGSRKAYAGFGSSGSTTFELINENTGSFIIGTNGSQQLIITSAGNVGIGTTSPATIFAISQASPIVTINSSDASQFHGIEFRNGNTLDAFIKQLPQTSEFRISNGRGASWGGHITFYTDTVERMRIASTGATRLNAYGSGSFTGTVAYNLAVDSSGNIIETAGGVVDGSGTANYVSKWSDANTLTDSQLFDNGTNVGIGTTSPTSIGTGITSLDIQGSNAGGIAFGPSGTKNYIYGASTMYVEAHTTAVFSTSGSEKMRLTTGGQLIVGGTTVGYAGTKLQVGNTSDSQNGLNILTSTTGYGYILFGDGAGADTYVGQIRYYHGDNYMAFQTNGSEKLIITSAGNVGIGTSSPATKLHVSGGEIRVDAGQAITLDTSNGMYLVGASNQLRLYNGANPVVNITTAGNVGIGTTSPGSLLHVYGTTPTVKIQGTGTASAKIDLVGPYTVWTLENQYINGATNDMFRIYNSELGADAITINRLSNNVGIGTTNPAAKLHTVGEGIVNIVQSSNTVSYTQYYTSSTGSGGTNDGLTVGLNGLDGYVFLREAANLILGTSDAERIRITSAGTVGIGTTSPSSSYKLDVAGAIRTTDVNGYSIDVSAAFGDNSGASISILNRGTTRALRILGSSNNGWGDILLNSYGAYVGIGTTTPTQTLHVSGNVRVTGAYYDSNNSAGSSGQVLSSTGSGTAWVNQGEAVASSLFDLLPNARVTYDWTVQLTAGTWADIFSSNTVLSNGTWMVQAYVSDFAVGGQQYQETYSGIMSWGNAQSTNETGPEAISEIVLHRSGHAANAGNFYLRTVERPSSTLLFQGMSNQTYSAASTINFKFVKIF